MASAETLTLLSGTLFKFYLLRRLDKSISISARGLFTATDYDRAVASKVVRKGLSVFGLRRRPEAPAG
jgi:hypothetical protein